MHPTFRGAVFKIKDQCNGNIGSLIVTLILPKSKHAVPDTYFIGWDIKSAFRGSSAGRKVNCRLELFYSNVNPNKLAYFVGILLALPRWALLQTEHRHLVCLYIREFYRNGILNFGGGQVLIP